MKRPLPRRVTLRTTFVLSGLVNVIVSCRLDELTGRPPDVTRTLASALSPGKSTTPTVRLRESPEGAPVTWKGAVAVIRELLPGKKRDSDAFTVCGPDWASGTLKVKSKLPVDVNVNPIN